MVGKSPRNLNKEAVLRWQIDEEMVEKRTDVVESIGGKRARSKTERLGEHALHDDGTPIVMNDMFPAAVTRERKTTFNASGSLLYKDCIPEKLLRERALRDKKAIDGVTFVLDGPNGVETVVGVDPEVLAASFTAVR